jgi:TetR/AcrR family transcriptional regulator, transcriptional repressor for nem operon
LSSSSRIKSLTFDLLPIAMPRPRSFDSDTVIEQLCDYFWEYGYSAASLDDLAQRLGVKRGSLFNAFGSKEVLFKAAFERYEQIYRRNFETQHQGAIAIAHYFKNAVGMATTRGMGRGCFMINLLMSPELPTPALQCALDDNVIFVKGFFDHHLNYAQQQGQLPQNISIPQGVDALFGATIGVFALSRASATPFMIQEFVNNNLRGLFGAQIVNVNQYF